MLYEKLAKRVSGYFVKNNIVPEESREIYSFGLENIISQFCGILFLFLVSLLLQAVVQGIVFYLVFKFVRKFAGGFHASTYFNCNFLYLTTFTITVFSSRGLALLPLQGIVSMTLSLFSLVTVAFLAPIENPNNPIATGKQRQYYLYALLISGGFLTIVAILAIFSIPGYILIAVTEFFAAVYMYIEIIKRRKQT
ncbi:MAG: accessory gene regulator B family protein [Oscillospiraceae bacterium]